MGRERGRDSGGERAEERERVLSLGGDQIASV